jgi:hypothetical protein
MQDLVSKLYLSMRSRIVDSVKRPEWAGPHRIRSGDIAPCFSRGGQHESRGNLHCTDAHPSALSQHADHILKRLVLALIIVFRTEIIDLGLRLV